MNESARHSLRISGKHAEQLLDNFGKIIHYQSCLEEDSGQDQLRTLSRFTRSVENLVPDLLPFSSQPKLIPKILKILHFLNFPSTEISVCLMHRSAQAITFTFFLLLKQRPESDEKIFMASVLQVCKSFQMHSKEAGNLIE